MEQLFHDRGHLAMSCGAPVTTIVAKGIGVCDRQKAWRDIGGPGAAQEIRRVGAHPAMVQVLVSSGAQRPYGDPFYWPIWEAAAEMGLPVALHLGGQGGVNVNPTGCGAPTFFWETHALLCETGMGHIASVIAHGIFEKYPAMRFVLIECGIAWLPAR